jgi:hypothetical protein
LYRGGFEGPAVFRVRWMCVTELLVRFIAASGHTCKLSALESVHSYAANEGDVNTQSAVDAGA